MTPRNAVLVGDAFQRLRGLADRSVDCVVTSPPYLGLRDYGVAGQLGQEGSVDDWVSSLRTVCGEIRRVLAPHGSLWLNLGDSYSRHERFGAPPKSLLLGPERVARALVADGWLLRNKVIWAKSNPLPSPSKDRLTTTYEVFYFLVKQGSYFFDLDAIRAPVTSVRKATRGSRTPQSALGVLAGGRDGLVAMRRKASAVTRWARTPAMSGASDRRPTEVRTSQRFPPSSSAARCWRPVHRRSA